MQVGVGLGHGKVMLYLQVLGYDPCYPQVVAQAFARSRVVSLLQVREAHGMVVVSEGQDARGPVLCLLGLQGVEEGGGEVSRSLNKDEDTRDSCESCRFWSCDPREFVHDGYCLRYPPGVVVMEDPYEPVKQYWPTTHDYDWCGEWRSALTEE
jgi:hypothetical protein